METATTTKQVELEAVEQAAPKCGNGNRAHRWGPDELHGPEVVRRTCRKCGVQRVVQAWHRRDGQIVPWYRYPGTPKTPKGMRLVERPCGYARSADDIQSYYARHNGKLYIVKYFPTRDATEWFVALDGSLDGRLAAEWDPRVRPSHVSMWIRCIAPT